MKIAITSDTHEGHSPITQTILDYFVKEISNKIIQHDCKALIHAGDWISHDQRQLEKSFERFRKEIKIPILTVFGNHDFWHKQNDRKRMSLPGLMLYHKKVCELFNIHHLQDNPIVIEDVIFSGLNGWYNVANPPSNDSNWMPSFTNGSPTHMYMQYVANQSLDKILALEIGNRKSVCVTHFCPPIEDDAWYDMCATPRLLEWIPQKYDMFVMGHSHKVVDQMIGKCRVINPGGDYDKPKVIIVEV